MIKLDENLLAELGLHVLPKEEKPAFLKHMYETLEMRVGTRLAQQMSDEQMREFEQFINGNDEQGAFRWLESNFPNYKEVVAAEFETLKHEIQQMAPQIVAASQAQAQAQQQAMPPYNPNDGAANNGAMPPQYQQPMPPQPPAGSFGPGSMGPGNPGSYGQPSGYPPQPQQSPQQPGGPQYYGQPAPQQPYPPMPPQPGALPPQQ